MPRLVWQGALLQGRVQRARWEGLQGTGGLWSKLPRGRSWGWKGAKAAPGGVQAQVPLCSRLRGMETSLSVS